MKREEKKTFISKTFFGLENILAEELRSLGADAVTPLKRAVSFQGDKELLYKANLQLRTALKILLPVYSFNAQNEDELYEHCREFNWGEVMETKQVFAVDSVVFSEYFTHSKYVALKVKDAIADHFREKTGKRPSVNIFNPDIRINVHIATDQVSISLDSSGDSLHKRGYRDTRHIAPLNEVLAAGMLKITRWDFTKPLLDPMCGSGTIPFEAAMMAANIPPGARRNNFGFMKWRDFDPELWEKVHTEATDQIKIPHVNIIASDISNKAVDIAREAAICYEINHLIRFKRAAFTDLHAQNKENLLILNPPYGKRMRSGDLNGLYKMIGDTLKKHFTGSDAWILSSNNEALKHIGLHPGEKHRLYNGPLECKFLKFSLYKGSKKKNN